MLEKSVGLHTATAVL